MFDPDFNLSKREYQLCKILWKNQPISTGALIALCREQIQWNKSTTLTYVRRLIQKGVLENKESIIKLLVSKESIDQYCIDSLIESTFHGSASELVAFLEKHYGMKN